MMFRACVFAAIFQCQFSVAQKMRLEPGTPLLNGLVYSLATRHADTGETNMNIVTYATKCSIQPEELWAVSVFKGTRTHDYFFSSKSAVLQLLAVEHGPLLSPLGQSSGRDIDKRRRSEECGFAWRPADGVIRTEQEDVSHWPELLDDCVGYVELRLRSVLDAGDHDLCLCEVPRSFRRDVDSNLRPLDMSIGRQFLE